ncbi:chromosome segregation SMC family protein [Candidatus Nitrosotenuis uzonensis]|uniref:SMC domain protein n=1 Tax=Candidatus Nitrosotenuis uzonensis TaxID=1407055 RepID=V6ARP3_9ARCH|nr:chromosome segregation SMC family protein [Candidatus Nitrosotenuis uzonensis]CDI05406.1 putative SMC domain protein [Candidatus Nitrosotenuis uzonensis]
MVHIKKVDIFGFKSFGFTNTTVNFEPGLVSISGPNGSGKSNILDAIIFALGENRPKIMRVDKLRSLIHDIEGTRRGTKMARVSLHFDNTDRKIPVDSNSVVITREMDEHGENIYYLNQKQTNRNQILDLLEVANASLNQLNAVQQGTVTRISEFTAEEKRTVIEDLIGLAYFDEKKTESIKQLEDADRRLEVALARMDEIKKRIDELEVERNLKLRYELINREIGRFHAISASNKMKVIQAEKISKERSMHSLVSEAKKLDEERARLKKEIAELESQKNAFMAEANAYNQAKASIDSEISAAMQIYESANTETITKTRRLEQILARLPEISAELERLHQTRSEIEAKIAEQKTILAQIREQKNQSFQEIKILESEISQVYKQQAQVIAQRKEVDSKIQSLTSKLTNARITFGKIESEIEDSETKIANNQKRHSELLEEATKLDQLKIRLESIRTNHKDAVAELKSRITEQTSKHERVERDIEEITQILEKASRAAAQYDAKIKVVKGIMHEDYTIASLKEHGAELGIDGLVYELISWDKEHERAVLAAASDWIKSFVVKDFTTLLSLAEIARTKKLPKLKIIPLEAIPKFSLSLPQDHGVIGILSDYVRCEEKFASLKTFLFGNIVLVDSRESAMRISKSGYKTVTLEGEFFESKGSAVIIDINSKISKLTKIISMSTSVDGLNQSINLLKKFIQKKRFTLKKIEGIVESYRERLTISETGLTNAEMSYSDLKVKLATIAKTRDQLHSRISQLQRHVEKLRADRAKEESFIASLEERIAMMHDNYADGETSRIASDLSRLNQRRSDLMTKQSTIVNDLREKESELATLAAQELGEKAKMRNLHEEQTTLNRERHEIESRINAIAKEKEIANENLVKLREKEQQLIATSGTSISKLQEFDQRLSELNEQERSITKEINAYERQSDSLARDIKDITENEVKIQKILEKYGYEEITETFDVDSILSSLESEMNSLTSKLNATAPETYVEVSSGYRSMSDRKNELEAERNAIVAFIEEIDKDKRQTFLEAFDKVDKEIREAFNTMTGGEAWLELQNEDDIFNSGISYLIQFPNKPKRESTSISGGEKTLAAIVFVLALQKLKPSVFYLFDEVDAHLDAPNSEKLAKIIEQRSEGSQFIMVSLKDSVVQKAKLIYGVYPKNGVSHVVTYKDKRMPSITG